MCKTSLRFCSKYKCRFALSIFFLSDTFDFRCYYYIYNCDLLENSNNARTGFFVLPNIKSQVYVYMHQDGPTIWKRPRWCILKWTFPLRNSFEKPTSMNVHFVLKLIVFNVIMLSYGNGNGKCLTSHMKSLL